MGNKITTTQAPSTTTTTNTTTSMPTHTPSTSQPVQSVSPDDLTSIIREELKLVSDRLLKEEVEQQIDEKLSGGAIDAGQRTRIHKKVLDDVQKQIPKLIDKVIEEQHRIAENENIRDSRVEKDLEQELKIEIGQLVENSMKIAIADEILQKVEMQKFAQTPTLEPKFTKETTTKLGALGIRHRQIFMILLFLAISFVQRVDLSVAIVAITESTHANPNFKEFKWDESVKGLLLSSFYWSYFFVQLPGGVLAEKYGPKMVMSISMTMCATTALFMPMATLLGGWIGLYVLKVLQGVSQGAFIPAVYVFTSKWIPPKEKSKLFTPAFGGMQLGTVIGLPISGFLCASPLGWPSTFFFSAIIGYLWVVVWIFAAANSPAVHRSISREEQLYIEGSFGFGEITVKGARKTIPWKKILTSKPFIGVMIGHFGENWAFFTLLSEMPIYLNHILNLDITNNALLSAMTYLCGWLLIVALGFIATFIKDKNLYSVGTERKLWTSIALYGSAISFFLLGITQSDNKTVVLALLTVTITTNSFIFNGLFSNHADLSPNYVGILMGLSNTIGNMSSLLAPLFVGLIVTDPTDKTQWSTIFLTASFLLVACNTVYLLWGSSEIQPWNTPSNLHLQLQDEQPVLGSSRQRYGVTELDSYLPEMELYARHHRNSI